MYNFYHMLIYKIIIYDIEQLKLANNKRNISYIRELNIITNYFDTILQNNVISSKIISHKNGIIGTILCIRPNYPKCTRKRVKKVNMQP